MIVNHKLVLDTFCEVYDLLKPYADAEFWNFKEHVDAGQLVPGAIYLIGRDQFAKTVGQIKQLIETNTIIPFLCNPAEGSWTMIANCIQLDIVDLIMQGKILLIAGGYMPTEYNSLYYENFLPKILDYDKNLAAIAQYQETTITSRPYKFLFLNGRGRHHRKQLLNRLSNLLDQSLWTNLDHFSGQIHLLPIEYEYPEFVNTTGNIPTEGFIKKYIMPYVDWPEIYIKAEPYIDTYFSLVTETIFEYPYTFRTEKIWKPIAIGHPWIAVSNYGYYRDMHNLGFQTFGHVIDESFDSIENDQDRLERIAQVVEDLCQQDLASFLKECYNVCKYNQQHYAEYRHRVAREFPEQFHQFINQYFNE